MPKKKKQSPELEFRELCKQIQDEWIPAIGDRVWSAEMNGNYTIDHVVDYEGDIFVGFADWGDDYELKDVIFLPITDQIAAMIIAKGYEPHTGYSIPFDDWYCRLTYNAILKTRQQNTAEGYPVSDGHEIKNNHISKLQRFSMLKAYLHIPKYEKSVKNRGGGRKRNE